ncbi:hypothetical protein IW261DRAFT_553764 [Armillaria novae-zelandiae]|uniref:Uncharacterized protein n=1 Tax=Armillaria novae-zelandiae TaxID=153914 RepID=A0AA39U4Y1_9AGAR|nr:hypothetical protein IW261DRAFT_553764 [Armillaria novae-zelandiae]
MPALHTVAVEPRHLLLIRYMLGSSIIPLLTAYSLSVYKGPRHTLFASIIAVARANDSSPASINQQNCNAAILPMFTQVSTSTCEGFIRRYQPAPTRKTATLLHTWCSSKTAELSSRFWPMRPVRQNSATLMPDRRDTCSCIGWKFDASGTATRFRY